MRPGMRMLLVSRQRENRGEDRERAENRFRDRTGRERYDDGRFAYDRPRQEYKQEYDRPGQEYSVGYDGPRSEYRQERQQMHMDRQPQEKSHNGATKVIGFDRRSEPFEEMANKWMRSLRNTDGTKGAHWTKDQAKSLMAQVGADADLLEYWSVLNALYSDYSEVLKKFGIDRTEVYAHLAKAWLDDEDAVQDKAKRYFEYIVEH